MSTPDDKPIDGTIAVHLTESACKALLGSLKSGAAPPADVALAEELAILRALSRQPSAMSPEPSAASDQPSTKTNEST
jgi:hypothetical protein